MEDGQKVSCYILYVFFLNIGHIYVQSFLCLCLCLTSHQQLRSYGDGAMA